MPVHEQKYCARCNGVFECKVGDIAHCHCNEIVLTLEERTFIEGKYQDCLCHQCLKDLKNKYLFFKEKYLLK
jgi:hypothetical protein